MSSAPKIAFAWNSEVAEIHEGDGKLAGLTLRDTASGETSRLTAAGLFVGIGHDPRTDLVTGRLSRDDEDCLKVASPSTRTDVPGVFGAGDLAAARATPARIREHRHAPRRRSAISMRRLTASRSNWPSHARLAVPTVPSMPLPHPASAARLAPRRPLSHGPENEAAPEPTEADPSAAQQVKGDIPHPRTVGPVGLEPTTNGLKVHCSAN